MKIFAIVLLVIILVGTPIMVCWAIKRERRDFNNGVCPKCGGKLRWVDQDSQGGRLWMCENTSCQYHTWVSYGCVDRDCRCNP